MEIHHKIKPIKNWREFLKEYGIIVLGVLTALGGEQAVEALHHRAEARETREALKDELSWNMTSFKLSVDQADCVAARLDELQRWRRSWSTGRPLKLLRPITAPASVGFRASVWRVSAGEAVSRMSFSERITYAKLYDGLDLTQNQLVLMGQMWAELMPYQQAESLTGEQLLQMDTRLGTLRIMNSVLASNYRLISDDASELSLPPSKDPVFKLVRGQVTGVCKPLLSA